MQKLQVQLPIPKDGVNYLDESLISDSEAAEGTINISFKDGQPSTRKGYVKYSAFNFTTQPKTMFTWVTNAITKIMVAAGGKIKKETLGVFNDITGSIASDIIETLAYPCLLGTCNRPDNLVTSLVAGGTLVAGTYWYRVTALTATGETDPSTEISFVLAATGSIKISWNKIQGATGYKVYGRTQSGELLMATIALGTTTTWIDTGAVTPSGAMSLSNSTPGAYTDKLFVLDGVNYQYFDEAHGGLNPIIPYCPSTNDLTMYGDNVLITAPSEINTQKFILNDNNRVWVSGSGKTVRMSALNQPDYFPSTFVWKMSEDVQGMAHFIDENLIFTENTCTLISGNTPDLTLATHYVLKSLEGGYGCKSHRSIAEGDNAIYWANKEGVYRYISLPSDTTIPQCVSEFKCRDGHTRSVKKIIQGITDWTKVFAEFFDHQYRLYIGNNQVLVYDTIQGNWALYEYNQPFNCGMIYDKKLYYVGPYIYNMDFNFDPDGSVYDGLSDDGVAIYQCLRSKVYDVKAEANKKKFKKLFFSLFSELISYDIDLNLYIDDSTITITDEITNKISRWGELMFGDIIRVNGTNLNYPIRIHHKGKKYNLQYELICSGLNMAWLLKDVMLLLKVKELR